MSSESSIIYPQRHLALILLALGFLVIWTAVMSGLMVKQATEEHSIAEETVKIFHAHEALGKIAFALGHEMGML